MALVNLSESTNTVLERINKIVIIGTLAEAKTEFKTDNQGREFISVNAVVNCEFKDEPINQFEVKFFSYKTTKTGAISKLYITYSEIEKLIGKKVNISSTDAAIGERRWYNTKKAQIESIQLLNGKFISEENDKEDQATFEISGFVYKPLLLITDEETGKITKAELSIGQTNYNGTALQVIKFHIEPNMRDLLAAIESMYTTNSTVHFFGDLRRSVITNTIIVPVSFGKPKSEVRTSVVSRYYITGGEEPMIGEDANIYSVEVINKLKQDYNAKATELTMTGAVNAQTSSASKVSNKTIYTNQSSLI